MKLNAVVLAMTLSALAPAHAGMLGFAGGGTGGAQFGPGRTLSGNSELGAQTETRISRPNLRPARDAAADRLERGHDRSAAAFESSRSRAGGTSAAGRAELRRATGSAGAGAAGLLSHTGPHRDPGAATQAPTAAERGAAAADAGMLLQSPLRRTSTEAAGQGGASIDLDSRVVETGASAHAGAQSGTVEGN